MLRRCLLAAIAGPLLLAGTAAAHTDSDLVAVPTGSTAEVTLRPTHGCGDAPTVEVATRVPVEGAEAVAVPGWSQRATPEGERTVLEWTGGSLPADQVGAFPVRFTVRDPAGELLTFPFVQECADGAELAWIDGDPDGEFPAPRLLVLPVGFEPAAAIEDVPADAPGRSQLTEIVDVDNPAPSSSVATTTAVSSTTVAIEPSAGGASTSPDSDDPEDDDDGSAAPIALGVIGAVLAVVGVVALRRRGARSATP